MSAGRDRLEIVSTLCRRPAGVRQKDVADAIGTTSAQLCNYESGRMDPKLSRACEWARARGYRLALVPVED